jgi:hypothetical protein
MKFLLFSPYAWASGQQEIALELLLEYRSLGYEIHLLECRKELGACDINPFHRWDRCFECHSTSRRTWDLVKLPQSQRHGLNITNLIDPASIPNFQHIDELKAYTWKGLPVGMGVATTAITGISRDTEPDLQKYRSFVVNAVQTFINVHGAVSKYLDSLKPDLFYCFNGRNVVFMPAFIAARERNIETWVGERDYYKDYIIFKNAHAVDLSYVHREIEEAAKRMRQDPQGELIASTWFKKNVKGNDEALCNYVRDQEEGKLPENFDATKHNIAIFPSSEDEISAAPGWENPHFKDQDAALRFILSRITDPSYHFYVRSHPHLQGVDCAQNRQMSSLLAPNLTIIPSESPVDTYALMRNSNKCLTFGSTMGIEACFWERPTILAGRSFYEKTGAAYLPDDREHLIQLLKDRDLPARSKEPALWYGYWWVTRGIRMKHIEPADPITKKPGFFRGEELMPSKAAKGVIRWYHRVNRIKRALAGR